MTPEVDVIILTWNDGALLDVAVESALMARDVDVQVVVVDNGSDEPVDFDDRRVTVIRNDRNRGVAAGRNQGVRMGSAPFVCLLDSDAALYEDSLCRLVDAVTSEDSAGLSAPVFTGQDPRASAGRAPGLARKGLRFLNVTDRYAATREEPGAPWWDVDFAIGACELFRREAYDTVGGIDETYFYGPEDVDFCLRLGRAGWRVVQVGAARCDHPPRRRNRQLLTRRGIAHAGAVLRYRWRNR